MKILTLAIVHFSAFYGILVPTSSSPLSLQFSSKFAEKSNPAVPRWVATVDGKSFFADQTGRNWTAAKEYCNDFGMELASIASVAEADALQAAYNFSTFGGGHWTSGRDAQEPRQFSWDSTGEAIPSHFPSFVHQTVAYQTCLVYVSVINSYVTYLPCSTNTVFTMCNI